MADRNLKDEEAVGSENEEEEDGEDEEESSEEEEEPLVKYARFAGPGVSDILKSYAITASGVYEKFMVIGVHLGIVFIVDYNGEEIRRFSMHTGAIVDISVAGEFLATAGEDGVLLILSMFSNVAPTRITSSRAIRAVALDPNFVRPNSKKAVAYHGKDDSLIISTEGWFGRNESVLAKGEGHITCIKWHGNLLSWASDAGVKIHDTNASEPVSFIPRPKNVILDDHHCTLFWEDKTVLWIAWGNTVQKVQIVHTRHASPVSPDKPNLVTTAVIAATFTAPYTVCGISTFEKNLMLVAFFGGAGQKAERPELVIARKDTFEDSSSDAVAIHNFEKYSSADYRLGAVLEDSMYFIFSPRDIVVCRARDIDDHITWLLAHEKFDEAIASAAENKTQRLPDVSRKYLDHLFVSSQVDKAVELCSRLLSDDKDLWEEFIPRYRGVGRQIEIAPLMPVFPALKQQCYDDVLGECLDKGEFESLFKLLLKWPYHLYQIYNIQRLQERVKEAFAQANDLTLPILTKITQKLDEYIRKPKNGE